MIQRVAMHQTTGQNEHSAPTCRHRGVVIIVVTIVIVLVSLAAYGFLTLMSDENMAAAARGDQLQAEAMAASGREYLAALLETPRAGRPEGAEYGDLPDVFGPIVVDTDETEDVSLAEQPVRQGRFCILTGQVSTPDQTSGVPESSWRRGYVNESAKLNLVTLALWDRRFSGFGHEALMNLPGMDESTADAILDWIDPDNKQRPLGAEADYYSGLDPPVTPRNGPPESLEELLQVRGVTRERLFGLDLNQNFRVDDWEANLAGQEAQTGATEEVIPWSAFLTVYSGERDVSYEGRPRVQLNQKDLGKLQSQLAEVLPPAWANFIVAYRQYGRYKGSGRAVDASNYAPNLSRPGKVRIRSPLDLIGVRVRIPRKKKSRAGGQGSAQGKGKGKRRGRGKGKAKDRRPAKSQEFVLTSPFSRDPTQMRDYLPKLMDATTVGTGRPLFGRVNINLAPRTVLLGVPGIDAALVERILAARSMAPAEEAGRHDPTWLLTEGLVDLAQMRRLLPYVTTGGDVGRAQIIGFYDRRSPVMRLETVIDATELPARQVYYKDLRPLGRGPLDDVLELTKMP